MTPERWQKVDEVFQGALDRAPQDRASFLDEACEGDAVLRSEAVSLINAYDVAGEFIEQPAVTEDARVLVDALDHNIGRDIGAYTILERLGAGGMGEVYLAQDRRLNRRVALKILPALFASDDMRLRRFQREAQAASALNHPNILTIHEVGEYHGVWFIATEFIDGQTLRELIERGSLSATESIDVAEQVASALATAHAAGIVHRDIKPENIMRRADGLVKILDFGIVKLLERPATDFEFGTAYVTQHHTELGEVMGTAGYMSPEQARGLTVDERTDIWSLGVVLYEMLAGSAPFAGDTRMDKMVAILDREPPALFADRYDSIAGVQMLREIVGKSLNKDKNERYQSALALAEDLRAVNRELSPLLRNNAGAVGQKLDQQQTLEQSGLATSVISHADPVSSPSRRTAVIAACAVGLVLAVVLGIYVYKHSTVQPQVATPGPTTTASGTRLYTEMTETEQFAFIRAQEQRISAMMGDRPAKLSDDALRAIKAMVDHYVARDWTGPGDEKLSVKYGRAVPYIPLIARSFAARKVPVIIGIYLPMVESAYRPCPESSYGARGLFQFLPETARNYGVSREQMCDAERMTPAAAAYIADHMAELGDDAESMTLVLLSFNRGATSVRSMLRDLRDTENYERNFWTLFAHREKLEESFRKESAGYVPNFFAAAIIGENPEAFGIQQPALSSLAQ